MTIEKALEKVLGKALPELLDVADPQTGGSWRVQVTRDESALSFALVSRSARKVNAEAGAAAVSDAFAAAFAGAGFEVVTSPTPQSTLAPLCEFRVPLGVPLRCGPCEVPKPWGKEIWFSGFEARGVCDVGGVPFPWLLAAGKEAVFGEGVKELLLLKILDPWPEPVRGDLYTEVHAEKNEVYVCTHAPKEGGWLRFGIHPLAWEEAGRNADVYKSRYLAAVREYEVIRRRLDAKSDTDASEVALEVQLRERMNSFTALHPLQRGSVARVPVGVPHALQAGCRVVEFQTATYERAIVSFAQKVLTQPHWDTEKALALLNVEEALRSPLVPETGEQEECIVDFPAFEVWRVRIPAVGEAEARAVAPVVGNAETYEILYVVEREEAPLDGLTEGAWFLPRGVRVELQGAGLVLRALPRRRPVI
ncbi:MAG: hypothetical protein IOD12_06510 [Silvanigrellales bacterium]|nr:hypothetical protein [Silvanigrellales bacterium]